jgi:hypothetical protein
MVSCKPNPKNLSFSTLQFNCDIPSNLLHYSNSYFDTLNVLLLSKKPDIVSFQLTHMTSDCVEVLEKSGYRFIYLQENTNNRKWYAPILINTKHISLLASSIYSFQHDSLDSNANFITWIKLKNIDSGHIFFVFNLHLQDNLSIWKSNFIGFELLQRIDKITAGVPVLITGRFNNSKKVLIQVLTENWQGLYPFYIVRNKHTGEVNFLVNEYLKVKNIFYKDYNDTLMSNYVVRFIINSQKVSRTIAGKPFPVKNK